MDTSFKQNVLSVVRGIRKGSTLTYKQVAQLAGSPLAFRAVGTIMKQNYDPTVPCHRVLRSDGGLGGYNSGGIEKKLQLLKEEGVFLRPLK